MKIQFRDSFFESMERYLKGPSFFEKIYDFFRYDLPYGIQNVVYFWSPVWNFRAYDHLYVQKILMKSLERQKKYMELNSNEIEKDLIPKISAMETVIKNLKRLDEDSFIDEAELQVGKLHDYDFQFEKIEGEDLYEMKNPLSEEEREHNSKVYERAKELEEECWKETWEIIKGSEEKGPGMRSWWY